MIDSIKKAAAERRAAHRSAREFARSVAAERTLRELRDAKAKVDRMEPVVVAARKWVAYRAFSNRSRQTPLREYAIDNQLLDASRRLDAAERKSAERIDDDES